MAEPATTISEPGALPVNFETHPSRYRHWRLAVAGAGGAFDGIRDHDDGDLARAFASLLASARSQWVTAQTLFVNGGYLAR